ncbi:hypothetical protein AB1N83_009513 [Pleurotus pulmonarius]
MSKRQFHKNGLRPPFPEHRADGGFYAELTGYAVAGGDLDFGSARSHINGSMSNDSRARRPNPWKVFRPILFPSSGPKETDRTKNLEENASLIHHISKMNYNRHEGTCSTAFDSGSTE